MYSNVTTSTRNKYLQVYIRTSVFVSFKTNETNTFQSTLVCWPIMQQTLVLGPVMKERDLKANLNYRSLFQDVPREGVEI